MGVATLTIDLNAICDNWLALDKLSAPHVKTAAVVKADGYGLGACEVANALFKKGARSFFVAVAEEGAILRAALGNSPDIYVFGGQMRKDAPIIHQNNLIPLLNAPAQFQAFRAGNSSGKYGIQLDSGMNRLGMEADEFASLRDDAQDAALIISHLACADEPDHPANRAQLKAFQEMTAGLEIAKSLSATGGTVNLGADYHFDMVRPGVGLYGGMPFAKARHVVALQVPVIQSRLVRAGESVGYGAAWVAKRDSKVATLSAGYADGLARALGGGEIKFYTDGKACPLIGRVSMDLITVDITDLDETPAEMELLCEAQGIEALADAGNTIGYEILTSIGARYERRYLR